MIQNPIYKALSILWKHRVKALVMGGQACVFYGASEFSRDLDLVLLTDKTNLLTFNKFLKEIQAKEIAVPHFSTTALKRGHAIHFRSQDPSLFGLRIDVMNRMRGVDSFHALWKRRTEIQIENGVRVRLLSLPDLVKAKKTQRDKDWPMLKRLVEASFLSASGSPTHEQIDFWLLELRSPSLIIQVAEKYKSRALALKSKRPLLTFALNANLETLENALRQEEDTERIADQAYWKSLKEELEKARHEKLRKRKPSLRGR